MDKRYYIPEVKDLLHGMEIEIRGYFISKFDITNVARSKDGELYNPITDWIKKGLVSVRYLNVADIEECGWKNDTTGGKAMRILYPSNTDGGRSKMVEDFGTIFEKNGLVLMFYPSDCTVTIYKKIGVQLKVVFSLQIKNKTELELIERRLKI